MTVRATISTCTGFCLLMVLQASFPLYAGGSPHLTAAGTPPPEVYSHRPDIAIPDNDTVGVFDTLFTGPLTIGFIEVGIDTLYHTWPGDIAITLESPRGEVIELMRSPGTGSFGVSGDDFINVVLSDTAGRMFETITSPEAPYSGYWRPDQALTSFAGVMPAGNWILHVTDNSEGDTGTLVRWSLLINATGVHDIAALTLGEPPPRGAPAVATILTPVKESRKKSDSTTETIKSPLPQVHIIESAAPRSTTAGQVAFWISVQNFGSFDEDAYDVHWTIDGIPESFVQNVDTLFKGTVDTIMLTTVTPATGIHMIRAWTDLGTDQNRSNDTANVFLFEVLPAGIQLRETFEDSLFPPPGWAVLNEDGNTGLFTTWYWTEDPEDPGPYRDNGYARTGYDSDNGVFIDDWMIGPVLPGLRPDSSQVDSLIFWAKSVYVDPGVPDSLQILVSNGSVQPDSFSVIGYFEVATDAYTRYAFRLPKDNGIRFAFRYIIYNGGPYHTSGVQVGVDEVRVVRSADPSTGIDSPHRDLPATSMLEQNYPNPFNPGTAINYWLPTASSVTLKVYDILGREVASLVNDIQQPGRHTAFFDGSNRSSGVYYYRFLAGRSYQQTKRMVLLR